MDRIVEPELLDGLPSDNPEAVASRRDLRMINGIMGNTRWLRRALLHRVRPQDLVVELGAGEGELGKSLNWDGEYTGLDLHPMPVRWPENFEWVQGNVFTDERAQAALAKASVVIGGLVLHHFSAEQLQALGRQCASARLLIFCEPVRRKLHLWQGSFLRLAGINRVTQHDLPVSVRAGFLGHELAEFLGLTAQWDCRVETTLFGAYRFIAERRS